MNEGSEESKKVMLSRLILHRALALEEEETWQGFSRHKPFLADILYLAVLLEKFVLHDRLVVIDELGVDTELAKAYGKVSNDLRGDITR